MKKVFEHPSFDEVRKHEVILRGQGISTIIRNTSALPSDEIPHVSPRSELWVMNDDDWDRALEVLGEFRRSVVPGDDPEWTCAACGQLVAAEVDECWKCQTVRRQPQRGDLGRLVRHPEVVPASVDPCRCPLTMGTMAVAVVVFIWQQVSPESAGQHFAPGAVAIYGGHWHGLLGAAFLHADLMHLVFNLYWLWVFGSVLERTIGRWAWAGVFVLCAASASAVEMAVFGETGIGLSGVVYGFFGFMLASRARYPAFAAVLSRAVVVLLLGWLGVCILLTILKILPVANGAHVGGLLVGGLLGLAAVRSGWAVLAGGAGVAALVLASVTWAPWSASFWVARAVQWIDQERIDEVFPVLDRVAASGGKLGLWAAKTSGHLHARDGNFAAAVQDFEACLDEAVGDAGYLNAYAWLLATAPDGRVRNGRKAVGLASMAANLTEWRDAATLDTLAAACAEAGDFAAAVEWQTLAAEQGLEGAVERLGLYRAGKRFRDSLPEASATR